LIRKGFFRDWLTPRATETAAGALEERADCLGNPLAPYQLYAVSVLRSFALAMALAVGMSTLADAAARQRRNVPSSGTYGAQYPTRAPVTGGGSYSADPHTRALQQLADQYHGGW
jgi:hypothetical protein